MFCLVKYLAHLKIPVRCRTFFNENPINSLIRMSDAPKGKSSFQKMQNKKVVFHVWFLGLIYDFRKTS